MSTRATSRLRIVPCATVLILRKINDNDCPRRLRRPTGLRINYDAENDGRGYIYNVDKKEKSFVYSSETRNNCSPVYNTFSSRASDAVVFSSFPYCFCSPFRESRVGR